MATSSVDLLSVLPGLQINQSDILQAELLLSQTLSSNDPTLDTRVGTAIRDLAIRPNASALALINKALVYYWTQNSLANVDDTTPAVFVDNILQNYFMTRMTGGKTSISALLYFASPVSVTLTTDVFFSTDNISRFFPVASATYTPSQLSFDTASNQYYLTVELVAENPGTAYNSVSGSLIYFSNFNPYFLHAEINYIQTAGVAPETNTQFIGRAKTSISTRNLVNTPSIISNLTPAFPNVSEIAPYGMGDTPMIRDKVVVTPPSISQPIWVHLGGCTDIYVRTPILSSLLQFTTDANGQVLLTGPILKVAISSIPGGPNTDTLTVSDTFNTLHPNLVTTTPLSIARSGSIITTATVTILGHGLEVGERFTVSGASPAAYNGVFQVASVIDANSFTYILYSILTTNASGNIFVQYIDRSFDNGFSTNQSIIVDFSSRKAPILGSGVSWTSNVVTVLSVAHGFSSGDVINIVGLSAYNGPWTITVTSPDAFTFVDTTDSTPVTSGNGYAVKLNANKSVSLKMDYFQDIDNIQLYLKDPANRVLSSDQLVRGFNRTMLDITITGYGGVSPNQQISTKVVTTYLASLSAGQSFVMGDLVAALSAAGIINIVTPITVTYTKYWRDLFSPTYGIITSALNPNDITNVFSLNTLSTNSTTI